MPTYAEIDSRLSPRIGAALRHVLMRLYSDAFVRARCEIKSSNDRQLVFGIDVDTDRSPRRSAIVKCPTRCTKVAVRRAKREVRAIHYLQALHDPELSQLPPEVLAHDPATGVIVMEDLARSRNARSLNDVLSFDGRDAAIACLTSLARALGRLHLLTFNNLPAENGLPEWSIHTQSLEEDTRSFRRTLACFDLSLDGDSSREVAEVLRLLSADTVKCFCHGDIHPQNVFISRSGVHLCDFTLSGFRHPLLEGLQAGCLFPVSVDAGGVPADVMQQVKAAYRFEIDLARTCDLARAEAAALIAFVIYHWTNTFPEMGLPIAFGGSRSKVLDLTRQLRDAGTGVHFPAVTALLARLGDALRRQTALAPDSSLLYDCFVSPPIDGAADHRRRDRVAPNGPSPRGVFRVNRHCHLLLKRRDAGTMAVFSLQRPAITCTARRDEDGAFRAVEMPLRLTFARRRTAAVEDTRTGKIVEIHKQHFVVALILHVRQFLAFWRYHYVERARANARAWTVC